ncbi:hypothetical protein G6M89_03435 [Natronolimnobius sp. AArcel1]|uniref:hypothetical protein n=1 Tax=Natronolimnobius sp. AArcel1 TaxID=1679093 RepID=UPI0013EDDE50|nr:hypothetical protein [Natronolimnobius sp. AArcel1]NGM68073.1 hypothetical protein [Natronolimnobius sp. AArcel1]
MSVRIEGFEGLSDRVESIGGENTITMSELFRPDFMQTYTDYDTIEAFFDESPWTVESQADFETIPQDEFDMYVDENTGFNSWEMMLKAAGREWISRQLNIS